MSQPLTFLERLPTPEVMARQSLRVRHASRRIWAAFHSIRDTGLRERVHDLLNRLCTREGSSHLGQNPRVQRLLPGLCALLEDTASQSPWWSAPGANSHSHHPYPGGWLIHNATNLHALDGLLATATQTRGLCIARDIPIAAMLLHDWAKPRMLLWREWRIEEPPVERDHHIAALLEAVLAQLPDELLVCLAGVHGGWWQHPERVTGFLEKVAEILDAPKVSRLARSSHFRRWSAVGWIMRSAETAWYGATRESVQMISRPVDDWIARQYPDAHFYQLKALIGSWGSELELAEIFSRGGAGALEMRLDAILLEAAQSAKTFPKIFPVSLQCA